MTNTSGPLCAALHQNVKDIMAGLPAPAANNLCGSLLNGPINTCNINAVVETALALSAGSPTCNSPVWVEPPGRPQALRDARPLPAASFPDVGSVYRREGSTFFWMFKTIQNLAGYTVRGRWGAWGALWLAGWLAGLGGAPRALAPSLGGPERLPQLPAAATAGLLHQQRRAPGLAASRRVQTGGDGQAQREDR